MKKIYSIFAMLVALLVVSCTNDSDIAGKVGYIKLDVTTYQNSVTRTDVPANYVPKQLAVEIVKAGTIVKSFNDYTAITDRIALEPGSYIINVHSNGWDGNGSGFGAAYYAGSTTVNVEAGVNSTAKVTCSLANVEVTVVYDASIKKYFTDGKTTVSSGAQKQYAQDFMLNTDKGSAYFPADDLHLRLSLTNKKGVTHEADADEVIGNVKPRDHYTITYALADEGILGDGQSSITVTVNDQTKDYTFNIPVLTTTKVSLDANTPPSSSIDATSATFTANLDVDDSFASDFDASKVGFEYRATEATRATTDWTSENVTVTYKDGTATAKVTNLNPSTSYEGRFVYTYDDDDQPTYSKIIGFETQSDEPQEQIYNASFESWYKGSNKAFYANEEGKSYWDSSNPGSSSFNVNVTNQETSFVHSGSSSAKLGSKYVVVKFAAASLFTGNFVKLIGTSGAELEWGVRFTSRPSALKGYWSYNAPAINRAGKNLPAGTPAKGDPDEAQIFCALLTAQLKVANASNSDGYEISMDIDWQNDPRVIAYGELTKNTSSNGQWEEFNIPLIYHDANAIPTHMLIVCSSSKYGDYFHGADSSVLYLDDFTFEYGKRTVR